MNQSIQVGARREFPSKTLWEMHRLRAKIFRERMGWEVSLLGGMEIELNRRELIKVKFCAFKDQKQELSRQLAERTKSHLVTRVGNVAVFFRRNPDPDKQNIKL